MRPLQIHALLLGLVLAGPAGIWAQPSAAQKTSWKMALAGKSKVQSAGEYKDNGTLILESFTALCMEPSSTASFEVAGPETRTVSKGTGLNHMVFHDTAPGLTANPAKEPFFLRASGSITGLTWVAGQFNNPIVAGEINTDGGAGGAGSYSRQGLMARWDQGNNFYWFYIDFATGTYGILRSRFFGMMDLLPNSTGRVPGFKNTNSYYLEFQLQGANMQGRIFEQTTNSVKGKLLIQTSQVTDNDPFMTGISGFVAEPSLRRPFEPLHGSFGSLASTEQ